MAGRKVLSGQRTSSSPSGIRTCRLARRSTDVASTQSLRAAAPAALRVPPAESTSRTKSQPESSSTGATSSSVNGQKLLVGMSSWEDHNADATVIGRDHDCDGGHASHQRHYCAGIPARERSRPVLGKYRELY